MTTTTTTIHTRRTAALLWTIQGLLALVFLSAGGMKLAAPMAALAQQAPLPPLFLKFIGLCEVAGALGLILPGVMRVGRGLTPLAAAGLVIIMISATVVTAASGHVGGAVVPCIVGLLAAFVAYKRRLPGRAAATSLVATSHAA